MGYGQTYCPRSPRSRSTSGCPNCPPTSKSRTPWKPSKTCKQRRGEISVKGNHHLHIQCSASTKLAAFIRKRHLNSYLTAHNTLYHLQKGPNGTSISIVPLRRTDGGLRCNRKGYIRKGTPLEKGRNIPQTKRERDREKLKLMVQELVLIFNEQSLRGPA